MSIFGDPVQHFNTSVQWAIITCQQLSSSWTCMICACLGKSSSYFEIWNQLQTASTTHDMNTCTKFLLFKCLLETVTHSYFQSQWPVLCSLLRQMYCLHKWVWVWATSFPENPTLHPQASTLMLWMTELHSFSWLNHFYYVYVPHLIFLYTYLWTDEMNP